MAILTLFVKAENVELDPAIRYGKLDNGLTYYIMHNEEPKERVSFYMVQKVGAILEEDSQNGLAHFLEHMAFNGTKHFDGKLLLTFLQRHGVAFGADINAYTATDETVYNLSNVPSQNEGVIDSCLLVLHDWSNYLALKEEEIDAERGVISEEWRTRRTPQFRMMKKQNEVLYAGSKYAIRDVIGSLDVIQNFKYDDLRSYYKKWYRPDLQGVVIVGDVDVDVMEGKVKELFSKIPKPVNPAERVYYDLPENKEPRFVLATDKEASGNYTLLQFVHKATPFAERDEAYLRSLFTKSLFSSMVGNRIQEKLQEEEPPFIAAQAFFQDHLPTALSAGIYIMHKPENWRNSLLEATRIIENVKDYGFTESELKRAKMTILANYEDAFKKKDKRSNNSYAMEIKDHFVANSPTPGIELELKYLQKHIASITTDEVSQWANKFLTDENVLIAVSGPEGKGIVYPSKEEVLAVLDQVKTEQVAAYTDGFKERELIESLPKPGEIVKTKPVKTLDAEELVLSNGIKVLLRHSDLEKEKILFTASSYGGSSLLSEELLPSAEMHGSFMGAFGTGDFTAVELSKVLTGKIVTFSPNVSSLSEGLGGSAAPKDLETLFQLIYLSFEAPRYDEKAFNALKSRYVNYVKSLSNDINRAFSDSVTLTMADHHPRVLTFNEDLVNKVSFEDIKRVNEERFADPSDFTFVFSGNYDEALIKDLIKKYIASLETSGTKEKFVDQGIRSPKVDTDNHFTKEMTVDKATVYVDLSKETKYSTENSIYMYVIGKLLDKRYLEVIREKEGGTYGVGVSGSFKDDPYDLAQIRLKFDCDAANADKLKTIALHEIDQIKNGEIIADELEEIKSNLKKVRAEDLEKLSFWHGRLIAYGKGKEKMSTEAYLQFVDKLSTKRVAKKAKKLLSGTTKVEVVMTPTK